MCCMLPLSSFNRNRILHCTLDLCVLRFKSYFYHKHDSYSNRSKGRCKQSVLLYVICLFVGKETLHHMTNSWGGNEEAKIYAEIHPSSQQNIHIQRCKNNASPLIVYNIMTVSHFGIIHFLHNFGFTTLIVRMTLRFNFMHTSQLHIMLMMIVLASTQLQ